MKRLFLVLSLGLILTLSACQSSDEVYVQGLEYLDVEDYESLNQILGGFVFSFSDEYYVLTNLVSDHIETRIDGYITENNYDLAITYYEDIKDTFTSLSDEFYAYWDSYFVELIKLNDSVYLLQEGDLFEALDLYESVDQSVFIGSNDQWFYEQIVGYAVPDLFQYFWNAKTISDYRYIEDTLEYVFSLLSEEEADIIIYQLLDLGWHVGNYDFNEYFLDDFVFDYYPDLYEDYWYDNQYQFEFSYQYTASELSNYLNNRSAIVYTSYENETMFGNGSAFFINDQGLLLTNYHVIEDAEVVEVQTSDGNYYEAEVVSVDIFRDAALLQIDLIGNDFMYLSNSHYVLTGQPVYAYGSPQGVFNVISEGIISKAVSINFGQYYMQTTAPISPGSSGGMVVNTQGEVIGIVVAFIEEAQNLNLVIPITTVMNMVQTIDPTIELYRPGNGHIPTITSLTIREMDYFYYYQDETQEGFVFLDQFGTPIYSSSLTADQYFIGEVNERYLGDGLVYFETNNYTYYGNMFEGFETLFGVKEYPNGDFYVGEFRNGIEHGQGNFYWGGQTSQFGDVYFGTFTDGKRTGLGTYVWPTGDIYVGEFSLNELHGTGEYYFPNGDYYYGEFFADEFNGEGEYYFANGNVYFGQFRDDVPYGEGILYLETGYFDAVWTDWDNGTGIYYYVNGQSEQKRLINGRWQS